MNKVNEKNVKRIIFNNDSSKIIEKLKGKYDEDELCELLLNKYNRKTIVALVPLFTKVSSLDMIARYFIRDGEMGYSVKDYILKLLSNQYFVENVNKDYLASLIDICLLNWRSSLDFFTLCKTGLINKDSLISKMKSNEDLTFNIMNLSFDNKYLKSVINQEDLEKVVLDSGSSKLVYNYALRCKGADIKKMEQKIIELNDILYIYLFALKVDGSDKKLLINKIKESKNIHYLILAMVNLDISLINEFNSAEEFLYVMSTLDMANETKMDIISRVMNKIGSTSGKKYSEYNEYNENEFIKTHSMNKNMFLV